MKRALLLFIVPVLFAAGCEKPNFLKTAAELATPTPAPTPKPATPAPGWMWDKYQNPLNQKSRK